MAVTNVTASNSQGVTTLVTNGTTTPNIAIGLGAITPTSIAAAGTVTGSNLSGSNTGDQTLNSLLPIQTGNSGKALVTDGSNTSWTDDLGFTPYYVPVSTTFVVPLYKQALFSMSIINDGTIIVNGYLIGV